jgi:voltage-gated potassium channel Kch
MKCQPASGCASGKAIETGKDHGSAILVRKDDMLAPLLVGSAMVVANMAIQIAVLLFVIRLLIREASERPIPHGWAGQTRILGWVVLILFLGHVLQFATWAALFVYLDEFSDYATSFYFSAVSFTSLGYGDIVMSERWRLLGALEAANGVLMFGLSAGAILSVMTRILNAERPHIDPRHDAGTDG